MSAGLTSFATLQTFPPLGAIILYAIAIVIGLACAWRVEKRLDTFIKYYVTALSILFIRMIVGAVGFSTTDKWLLVVRLTDVIAGVFFVASMVVMYKMIRHLNSEKK